MRVTKYIVLALMPLCLLSCKKDFSFHEKSIGALEMTKEFNYSALGLPSEAAFNPVSTKVSGDTIFVANNAADFYGIIVLNKSTGEVIKHLTEWTYNDAVETFDNQIVDVAVNGSLVFVVNRSSRIDVFKRADFSYVTTIGKTGWQSSSLLQCESADVAGDQLFIRDKQKIVVVNIADCTPANRFKVPNFITSSDSTSSNNGFNIECARAYQDLVYISDFERSRILVIDPKSATEKNGKLAFKRSIVTASKPLAFSFCNGTMMVVCQNSSILQIDLKSGKTIATYTSFANAIEWKTPGYIFFDGETFYINGGKSATPYMNSGVFKKIEVTTVS